LRTERFTTYSPFAKEGGGLVATARSFPAQEAGRQSSAVGASQATARAMPAATPEHAWQLLAQLPEVPTHPTPESEKAAAAASTAATEPIYRFDPAEPPESRAPVETAHAGRRAAQATNTRRSGADNRLPEAGGLPVWAKPLHNLVGAQSSSASEGASRRPTSAGSIVRFLLLVALFTAAGVSIRLMSVSHNRPTTPPADAPSPAAGRSASSTPSVSSVPLAATSESPVEPAAPAPIPDASSSSHVIATSTVAVVQPPEDRYDDESPVTLVYPKTLYPAPSGLETLETDERAAAEQTEASAIARLPGYILEIPPHQAQHEHEESIH
jgi:hypothetical protein